MRRKYLFYHDDEEPFTSYPEEWSDEKRGYMGMKMPSELSWKPAVDIIETKGEIVVMIEISGIAVEDVSVITDGSVLKFSGIRRGLKRDYKIRYHKVEIQVGRFEREIKLPAKVDSSEIEAHYRNGILEINMKKLQTPDQVRRIQID